MLRPQLLYHVARNSRGSLPVYSDVRNAGSRYLVYIRNVDGNVADLVNDLTTTLFPESSAKISTVRNRHVVIQGGRCKDSVMEWLASKGF
ncbi:ribosomal protein L49/IMG2 [Mucidula mucida]|nr:ribosomal protein L49/IMG2 [Mucidula mucida]